MESWVSLGGKEGRKNVQHSNESGIALGTVWSEVRDITNCTNRARPKLCQKCLINNMEKNNNKIKNYENIEILLTYGTNPFKTKAVWGIEVRVILIFMKFI